MWFQSLIFIVEYVVSILKISCKIIQVYAFQCNYSLLLVLVWQKICSCELLDIIISYLMV